MRIAAGTEQRLLRHFQQFLKNTTSLLCVGSTQAVDGFLGKIEIGAPIITHWVDAPPHEKQPVPQVRITGLHNLDARAIPNDTCPNLGRRCDGQTLAPLTNAKQVSEKIFHVASVLPSTDNSIGRWQSVKVKSIWQNESRT